MPAASCTARDLKPANVMVGAFGEVQVMDWGLAKVRGDGLRCPGGERDAEVIQTVRGAHPEFESLTGSILGTPAYMPPEQARGEVDKLDTRSDVFCLGGILCEILTGSPPYEGVDSDAVRALAAEPHLDEVRERLTGCRADPELRRLALECLAEDPGERPRHAGEVADGVARYLAAADERARAAEVAAAEARVRAKTAHQRERAAEAQARQERVSRRLTVALALAIGAVVVLGGGGWLWIRGERQARMWETERAVTEALNEAAVRLAEARQVEGDTSLAKLDSAAAAVRRAEAVIETGDADEQDRARVQQRREEVEARTQAAHEAQERARVDRAMSTLLAEIRLAAFDENDRRIDDPRRLAAQDARYAAAFADYGLDVVALETEDLRSRVIQSAISWDLVGGLRYWAQVRHRLSGPDERHEKLVAAIEDAYPEPWGKILRGQNDVELLRDAAGSIDIEMAPPQVLTELIAELGEAGDPELALRLARQAQDRHPDDFGIHIALAHLLKVHVDPPDYRGALECLRAAVAIRPGSYTAWSQLGYALLEAGEDDRAMAVIRKLIPMKPDFALAHFHTAGGHLRTGDLEGSLEHYRNAIRLGLPLADGHTNLGVALLELGELKEAERETRLGLAADPDDYKPHNNLGVIMLRRGDYEGAAASFREAIRLNPNIGDPHAILASALHHLGDDQGALAAARDAAQAEPGKWQHHNTLGDALSSVGDRVGAIAAYREAVRLSTDDPILHYKVASNLANQGEQEEALVSLREAVRLKPDFADAWASIGMLCIRSGWYGEALSALQRADELGTPYYPTADLLEQCETFARLEPLVPAILAGADVLPEDASDRASLAMLLQQKDLDAEAARIFLQLVDDAGGAKRVSAEMELYAAACCAARAAESTERPDAEEWRRHAHEWLGVEFARRQDALARLSGPQRLAALERLSHWLEDPDLESVRGDDALASMPELERRRWRSFWVAVAEWLGEQR